MINAAIRERLIAAGEMPYVIDLVAPNIELTVGARARRLVHALTGLVRFALRAKRPGCVYISVSGGIGKVYDTAYSLLARIKGVSICLHHHSFAYLRRPSRLARLLCRVAGERTCHVVQSPGMAARLRSRYGVSDVVAVSNSVFQAPGDAFAAQSPRAPRVIGMISNLTAEKGVFEFLDMMTAAADAGLALQGVLAGPCQDAEVERRLRERLQALPQVQWLGPVHGEEKKAFFDRIDVMAFPTRYANETEGIVNHEAMRAAVPVIANGFGCIPEIVANGAGQVIDPESDFSVQALAQLRAWVDDPSSFEEARRAASLQFQRVREASQAELTALLARLRRLAHEVPAAPRSPNARSEP